MKSKKQPVKSQEKAARTAAEGIRGAAESVPSHAAPKNRLPTLYQLCRLAVALRGADAGDKPMDAVRSVLALWLTAEYELNRARANDIGRNMVTYCRSLEEIQLRDFLEDRERERFLKDPDNQPVDFGSGAMDWLHANAPHPEDQFKLFENLEKGWNDAFSENATRFRKFCCRKLLQLFLQIRETRRRDADRRRKERKKVKKLGGRLETEIKKKNLEQVIAKNEEWMAEFTNLVGKQDPASKRRLNQMTKAMLSKNL